MGGTVGSRLHLRHDNLSACMEENRCLQLVVASKYVKVAWDSRVTAKASGRVMKRDGGLGWATLHPRTVIWRQEESGDSKGLAGMVLDGKIQLCCRSVDYCKPPIGVRPGHTHSPGQCTPKAEIASNKMKLWSCIQQAGILSQARHMRIWQYG